MFSRHVRSCRRGGSERRGSVLILVIAILAMLFVLGSTQLMVARFERKMAEERGANSDAKDVAQSSVVPTASSLNEGTTGLDAVAYNSGWNAADGSLLENSVDFTGAIAVNPGDANALKLQKIVRSGDLLTSSVEPFKAGGLWMWYFMSWSKPGIPFTMDGAGNVTVNDQPGNITGWATPLTGSSPVLGNFADADGDGVVDARWLASVNGCDLYQRVLPHGGLVTLDAMTHPALLAQVIHPLDATYFAGPWTLFNGPYAWNGTADRGLRVKDEGRLRRRFMLSGSVRFGTPEWSQLLDSDLRKLLPYTLGYRGIGDGIASHAWRVGGTPPADVAISANADLAWWESRMTPGPGPTEAGYNKNADKYDRQHLLTTHNSDDLLRPIRDEKGGAIVDATHPVALPGIFVGNAQALTDAPLRPFYYLLNPTENTGTDPLGVPTRPNFAYGLIYNAGTSAWSLAFNKPGLRTAFSLRDVLVNPGTNSGYQASYRRAMQLTAYYLAMIQHTSTTATMAPNDQLRMAAQLAVNTIDFADRWTDANSNSVQDTNEMDPITRFTYSDSTGMSFDVCGVERQPYITEAYVRAVVEAIPDPGAPLKFIWNTNPPDGKSTPVISDAKSIYAVELYNPYDEPMLLEQFSIKVGGIKYPLAGITIPAFSYIVVANTLDDPTQTPGTKFIPLAYDSGANRNFWVLSQGPSNPTALLKIEPKTPVELVRDLTAQLNPTGGAVPGSEVVVDRIEPNGLGAADTFWASVDISVRAPGGAGDLLVRDTSLQRRKELTTVSPQAPYVFPPQHWQFTLSRQMQFPLPWYEDTDNATATLLPTDTTRPYQHNLLITPGTTTTWTNNLLNLANLTNQKIVAAEFDGLLLQHTDQAAIDKGKAQIAAPKAYPIAPFPVIVADRGIEVYVDGGTTYFLGTAAFPTTGSLLLVTKDGHTSFNGMATPNKPLSASIAADTDKSYTATDRLAFLDHGHMPVFDTGQTCLDIQPDVNFNNMPQGRYDMPWGQLAFQYFTALPLEDLTNLPTATFQTAYSLRYPLVPYVEPASDASSPFGPRVRGRVNINFAPAWVLDGMPVLPDAVPGSTLLNPFATTVAVPAGYTTAVTGVPASELLSGRLDPVTYPNDINRTGRMFLQTLIDEASATTGLTSYRFPTLSAAMARYMVSYREQRLVPLGNPNLFELASFPDAPGFLSAGEVCDLISRIKIKAAYNGTPTATPLPLSELRTAYDPAVPAPPVTTARPFTYLGYLHLIAPVVRLQDWATVKSHVYTVYNLVGDGNGTWLRSQTTIDRTRCLYTNDLPERIVQTEPMDYFNTVSDQQ